MKEGFTVEEIEKFGKAHKMSIFLCAIFILSAISNSIFWDSLSIWLVALGGVAGLCFSEAIYAFLCRMATFIGKQERTVRLIFAGVAIAIAIVFPPLHFLKAGLITGVALKYKIGALHPHLGDSKHHSTKDKEGS